MFVQILHKIKALRFKQHFTMNDLEGHFDFIFNSKVIRRTLQLETRRDCLYACEVLNYQC